jgi:eukaryotic-like serine/threonine-protein kinase
MGVPERIREALADRYTIEREIGRGGMAVVHLARDLRHNRRPAGPETGRGDRVRSAPPT